MVSGRLRAAMVRAGKRANYADLKKMLEAAGYTINKQTVHNWFKPSCKFIDQDWLFKVAAVLQVNPEWLSTGEGRVVKPQVLSDEHEQVIGVWRELPDDDSRTKWLRDGESLLSLLKKKTRVAPYEPVTSSEKVRAKR